MLNDVLKEGMKNWIDINYSKGTSKEFFIERIKKYRSGYNGHPIIKSKIIEFVTDYLKNL